MKIISSSFYTLLFILHARTLITNKHNCVIIATTEERANLWRFYGIIKANNIFRFLGWFRWPATYGCAFIGPQALIILTKVGVNPSQFEVFSGTEPLDVTWVHDNCEVQDSAAFRYLENKQRYQLLIQDIFPEDAGTYSCCISNKFGSIESSCEVTIQGNVLYNSWFINIQST